MRKNKKAPMTANWLQAALRTNVVASIRLTVRAVHIVRERGLNGHMVVVAVIPRIRGRSSLGYTENYHAKFRTPDDWPQWEGKPVDVQFAYPGEEDGLIALLSGRKRTRLVTVKVMVPKYMEAEVNIAASSRKEAERIAREMYEEDKLDFSDGECDYDEAKVIAIKCEESN